jgi:hypothetical protein
MSNKIFKANDPELVLAYRLGKTIEFLDPFVNNLVWKEVYHYTNDWDLPRLSNESFIYRIQKDSAVSSFIPENICNELSTFMAKKEAFFNSYGIAERYKPALEQIAWHFYKLGGKEALDETN